ncbi:hypothetical protein [Enterococcus termitis]|uniref:Phage protein n=1 Tax=Enterococcus termitis TaxID=332950 RepID=A0A1E5H5L5_9ENTE|nr:hypothetical protein [Enterococcus termitis]OEG20257.1 hypothetical protein BCR25_00045 [Enterococcus termitis]OJG97328.1 hypothetical protein RV18_GL001016 [Enterococcus termitis]
MRYLNIEDFNEIDRLTIPEYELRIKAYQLKSLDMQYNIHLQAWATVMAGQTRKGKPVYRTFDKFFNYQKAEKRILGRDHSLPKNQEKEKLQNWIANFNS